MSKKTVEIDEARQARDIENEREISLSLIKSTTAFAVRTPKGQKDPGHYKWDPKNATPELSAQTIHALERSDDNIGIHLFGTMVDVDVDTDNPNLTAALDYFLPHTAHIWGRPSRPRTHRLYEVSTIDGMFDPSSYKFLQAISKWEGLQLEMRGGHAHSARYCLMPGSLHPSGEYYRWENLKQANSTPIIVPAHQLVKSVRLALVAAYLAPYWIDGQRNFLNAALCGFMHRVSQITETTNDPYSVIDKDDVEQLVRGLAEITDDDENDFHSRLKTLDATWAKGDEGLPIAGASRLAELTGLEDLRKNLYALLIDSEQRAEYENWAKNFGIMQGTTVKIVDLEAVGKHGVVPYMGVEAFSYLHQWRKLDTGGKLVPYTAIFGADPQSLRLAGNGFRPDQDPVYEDEDGHKLLNHWSGFRVPPAESCEPEDVAIFTDYVFNLLANGDEAIAHWITAWMADIFQYPASKPGTALILVGEPGSGKSTLGALFLRKMIGPNHCAVVNDVKRLLEKFNADTAFKLLIQCDEAISSRQKENAQRMKAIVTDERRMVEFKNVDTMEVDDFAQIILTSNNMNDALSVADMHDRRYMIQAVNDKYATMNDEIEAPIKEAYFDALYKWGSDDENLAKLHRYFLDYKYERSDIRKPMDTEARRDTIQNSVTGFDAWLLSIAEQDNPVIKHRRPESWFSYKLAKDGSINPTFEGWPDFVSYGAVKDLMDAHQRTAGGTRVEMSESQIVQSLQRVGLLQAKVASKRLTISIPGEYNEDTGDMIKNKIRPWVREWPSKKKLHEYLAKRYGWKPMIDESQEEEAEAEPKPKAKKTKKMEF